MTNVELSQRARTVVTILDRLILGLARHWLLIFNLVFGLYAGLPLLAPLLMTWGQTRAANVIYFVYQFLCHQMPSRCYYIGRFQVGLAMVRDRTRPLPIPVWLVLVAPLALDGITQLVGLRTSTWQVRTMTGLLASGATIWMAYPYLEQAFDEAEQSAGSQLRKAEASSSEDR
jgi:uncharacterized membrane protein